MKWPIWKTWAFLEQPHTSAGRIPSAKGYRFYVDAMLHSNGTEREDAAKNQ